MRKPVLASIIVLYLFSGFLAVYLAYRSMAVMDTDEVRRELTMMEVGSRGTNEMVKRLPGIFRDFPAASMILLLNQKNKLLGSLYEPSRINKSDYNEILKSYRTTEIQRFSYIRVLISSGNSVWVIAEKNASFGRFVDNLLKSNNNVVIIFGAYGIILLVMIMFWLFDKVPDMEEVKSEENQFAPDVPEFPVHKTKPPKFQDKYLANKIMLLMETIETQYATSKITFYSREGGKWRHVLEKSGNLVVKGDVGIEYLPLEITEIADKNWREPLISNNKRILFIPLYYRNNLFGLLRICLSDLASDVSTDALNQMAALCLNYSHAIFMQRIYDKAITDVETDFYNYPYFYFSVKEKLSAGKSFAVVVFEISDFNRVSPESTRNWSSDLLMELEKEGMKPRLAARLERARFSLLFDVGNKEGEVENLSKLNQAPGIIRKVTTYCFKNRAKLSGGFFIRPTGYEDTETFMQRLDYLIINSKFSAYSMDFEDHMSLSTVKSSA